MSWTFCRSDGGRCSTSPTRRWSAGQSCWSRSQRWVSTSTPPAVGEPATRRTSLPKSSKRANDRRQRCRGAARVTDRSMSVPEGLAGMRVDAGLARLLGVSRTAAAALAEDGGVELDGVPAGKSDRLTAGAWLQVRLPEPPAPLEKTPVDIEGMTILYSDDDIVAVDKPAGVAAHASVGWTGPTVLGGLAAAGYRITTSGVHERQGIVHRLDVGTSGVMVVAISERAYTLLKRAFKERTIDKGYHARGQGP